MKAFWILPILFAAILLYEPSRHVGPFDDDYSMIRDGDLVRQNGLLSAFTNPQTWGWFRPIRALMSSISTSPGKLPWGPHIVNIISHCIAVVLVFLLGRHLFRDHAVSLLVAGFMAFSQANAMAVLAVDGFNELGVSIAWYAGTLALLKSIRGSCWWLVASVLVFCAGLFTKESMVAFPLVATAVVLTHRDIRRPWLIVSLYFSLLLLFLAYRQGVVGADLVNSTNPDGAYVFGIGAQLFRNIALLLFSLTTPLSSLRLATAGGLLQQVFAVSAAGAFASAVCLGLFSGVRSKRIDGRTCLFLLLLLGVSSMPNILLRHVSELYSYRMSGTFFLLAAIGLTNLAISRNRIVLTMFGVIWLAFNLYAVHEKMGGIYEAGERAGNIIHTIERTLPDPESGTRIHVYDEWGDFTGKNYSVFSAYGVRVFRTMFGYALNRSYGRTDLVATVDEGPAAKPARSRPPELHVFRYLVGEDLVEWVPPENSQ